MSSKRFITCLLGLAAGLLLVSGPALAAPIAVPPGWAIVNDQPVKYFVFKENMGQVSRDDLVESKATGTTIDRRNEVTSNLTENGAPTKSERIDRTSTLVNPADRRTNGRYTKTYQIWRNDKIKVVTTTTPFVNYLVTDYERRINTILANTYATTKIYSWTDPITGGQMTHTERVVGAPRTETSLGTWGPAQDRSRVGDGSNSSDAKQVVESKTEDRLVGTNIALAKEGENATGAFEGKLIQVISSDASKGSGGARSSSVSQAFAISGSTRAQSTGNFKSANEEDVFKAAKAGVVLYDEDNVAAWKLAAGKDAIAFIPYDSKGTLQEASAISVTRGFKPTNGQNGGRIHIKSFSAGSNNSLALSGDFRNPVMGGKGKGSGFLVTR